MKQLYREIEWFLKQKIFVAATLLTALCCYGFAITHYAIGIDDTMVDLYVKDGFEVIAGRWTNYLLNKVFYYGEFSPFMLEVVGVMLLLLTAVLFCVLLRRIVGEKVGIAAYTLFICSFISYPFISELYIYYYHSGEDIGYCLTALALILFYDALETDKRSKKGIRLVASMLLLCAAVGCYESFIILYLYGVILILFLRGMFGKEKLLTVCVFRRLVIAAILVLGCIVLRTAVLWFLNQLPSLQGGLEELGGTRTVSAGLKLFEKASWLSEIFMLIKRYWLCYFVNGAVYFPVTVHVIAITVLTAVSLALSFKRKNGWYFLLSAGLVALPALLTFVQMQPPLYRTCQYLPLLVGTAVFILYVKIAESRWKKYGSLIFVVCSIVLIYNQSFEMNKSFYTEYRKYEHQRDLMIGVAQDIIRQYGRNTPVIITGDYDIPQEFIKDYYADFSSKEFRRIAMLTDWLDPDLKSKYYSPLGYYFGGEAMYSVIEWGFTAYNQPGTELRKFLEMHGYELQFVTDTETISQVWENSKNMPRWPEEGSMILQNGYVLVHL